MSRIVAEFEELLNELHEGEVVDGDATWKVALGLLAVEAVHRLASAARAIAHGDVTGPAGLEGLTMALAGGVQPGDSLAEAVRSGLGEIATVLGTLAPEGREP